MKIVNNESINAIGKRFAEVALDQGIEFGTVENTIAAYRENLIDTLSDQGLESWVWTAIEAFDSKVNKC